jgi:DNA-binding MarR family transcriptional regulator
VVNKAKKSKTRISTDQAATIVEALDLLSKLGIESIAEAAVFCHAALNKDATLTQIVRELRAPFSSVSRVVYQLERRGLVHYDPHPTDRRVKIVRANVSD